VRHDLDDPVYHCERLTLSHPHVCFFTQGFGRQVAQSLRTLQRPLPPPRVSGAMRRDL
jgi:hypothetical protein